MGLGKLNVYDLFSRPKRSLLENQVCVGRYVYTVQNSTIIIRFRHTFLKLYVRISGMTLLTQHK